MTMCNTDCNQGRNCHCAGQSLVVNAIGVAIWLAAVVVLAGHYLEVFK